MQKYPEGFGEHAFPESLKFKSLEMRFPALWNFKLHLTTFTLNKNGMKRVTMLLPIVNNWPSVAKLLILHQGKLKLLRDSLRIYQESGRSKSVTRSGTTRLLQRAVMEAQTTIFIVA